METWLLQTQVPHRFSTALCSLFPLDNHRIQAFDIDGRFQFAFGRHGRLPGEFGNPYAVCTDNQGNIVVSDSDNSRIQVLTTKGEWIMSFGEEGRNVGRLVLQWTLMEIFLYVSVTTTVSR